ncbi:CDP-diacylglycerol--glycerol-3-phosphate 3-phosphatidyltransferase [Amaricoccus macauensis]|uniref:CDP-diacylglycerol--glycerol-3-phosphate 3-phosphatidyltransferase n=1 Tax=Amaricoccus macauensis TaxID=57001 RepID=UPI003C79F574
MTWTIPNILTLARLVAAPGVALAYAAFPRPAADWVALSLFILAALTDYLDGRLARAWGQESNFGRMLDPIADKAMVIIALSMIVGLSGINPLILIPTAFILLREVFVSGLREFLGADAGRLKVTPLAKWKTTVQMVAIPVLFLGGVLRLEGAGGGIVQVFGIILIWVAGGLTVMTGYDYLQKAIPFLKEPRS